MAMKEVGIQISTAELTRVPKLEECDPGFAPHEFNVLCAMQAKEAVTPGGIIVTDQQQDTESMASQLARLVSVSPLAWTYAQELIDRPDGAPKVGDVVVIGRYSGTLVQGKDGRDYRILKDRDVAGVVL